MAAPTGRENQGKGIRQLQDTIRHENLKIHELDKEWARMRRKCVILDEEISKINTEIAQVDRAELREQGLASPPAALEQLATLLSWL